MLTRYSHCLNEMLQWIYLNFLSQCNMWYLCTGFPLWKWYIYVYTTPVVEIKRAALWYIFDIPWLVVVYNWYTTVCGYAYHIWCNITHSTQNGKQISNTKRLNQPKIIHPGCWVDGRWTLGYFVNISAVWLVGRGIVKDVNAWLILPISLLTGLFHYKLLPLITSSTRGIEYNSYNTISWAMTEIYVLSQGRAVCYNL